MRVLSSIAERVNEELAAILHDARTQTPELAGLIDELARVIGAGGKRLRPSLCVLGYQAVTNQSHLDFRGSAASGARDALPRGAATPPNPPSFFRGFAASGARGSVRKGAATPPNPPPIFAAAASLELLHTFALLHDDVMDESMTRRGVTSTLAAKGAPIAILAGDLAFVLSDRVFAESGFSPKAIGRARRHLDRMRVDAIAGQYLQMTLAGDRSLDQKSASKIASLKTGSYTVEGPLAVGAALGDASAENQSVLAAFAAPLGEAFQLMDDLKGLERGAGGVAAANRYNSGAPEAANPPNQPGVVAEDDIRTGAPTYLVATGLVLASANQRALILAAWGVEKANEEQVEAARKALIACGAAELTVERAAALVEQSRIVLESSQARRLNSGALIVLNEVAASIMEGRVQFARF